MKEIILAGRPNSGKSTLFNSLASGNQKVGNYSGCTVEKKTAVVNADDNQNFEITDLPGLYSLKPNSIDEEVALRHLEENREKSQVVFVLDGNNLDQELILPLMLKKRGYNLAIAVNMMDEVKANNRILNIAGMKDLVGIPFFPISALTGEGVDGLKRFLLRWDLEGKNTVKNEELSSAKITEMHRTAKIEARKANALNTYPEVNRLMARDAQLDKVLLHPFIGPVVFIAVMFILFQSIFTWAAPLSDIIDNAIVFGQDVAKAHIPFEFLSSLISEGVFAGVGAVLVFVPQIAILFLLIGLLEYSGYLPRVAYMVDRTMKPYGLDGKVFIPLLSSVACAVPGIMATRNIESERTRIITIMISPLMTCSARLPVYTLLISSFIPNSHFGPLSMQGLVMFGMYMIAVVMALFVAFILHKIDFQKRKHLVDFIHLPHYRAPNWKELYRYVWMRVFTFIKKAGTIIFSMSVLLWVLLSYPKNSSTEFEQISKSVIELQASQDATAKESIENLESKLASLNLEASMGGRLGKLLEPVFRPIGYDWKLTIGILSSLAAREVFVSTLGTVFALGSVDETSEGLSKILTDSKREDGSPAYTLATCLSLLMFFAFSLQCISTIGVAKRETNSWKIPSIMFIYMFFLAYGSAYIAYKFASLIS